MTRYTTEIIADEMTILTWLDTPKIAEDKPVYSQEQTPSNPSPIQGLMEDDDDDLPF